MKFKKYTIKTVEEDVFYRHYILIIISKIRQKFKNSPIIKKRQVSDIMLDVCIKFECYPTKTLGADGFCKKSNRRMARQTD